MFGEGPGQEVHAASFIRERRLVLDEALRRSPGELSRIALHELFHFVWVRLSNAERRCWEELLRQQMALGATGELGWSAEKRLASLRPADIERRSRRWREYVCESFCDSAAWAFGLLRRHGEFTLPEPFRSQRRQTLAGIVRHHGGVLPI
ncbi:MAG: hypothetical protein NZR01_01400 [Bryobacteraceae bacterium]|nr:hypothetical protein [Bryobacteraceae bacterium]